jgi:hypothetical protein
MSANLLRLVIINYEKRERLLASTGSAGGSAVLVGTVGHAPLSFVYVVMLSVAKHPIKNA